MARCALAAGALLVTVGLSPQASAVVYYTKEANLEGRGGFIGRVNLDGSGHVKNIVSRTDAEVIAISDTHVFWAENSTRTNGGRIGRARLNGTDVRRNFIKRVQPTSLVVHGGYLYWSNRSTDSPPDAVHSIGRARLSGRDVRRTFIRRDNAIGQPGVDGSHIYWQEFVETASGIPIWRADLNGRNVEESGFGVRGTGLLHATVDVHATDGRLFWSNYDDTISGIDLAGSRPTGGVRSLSTAFYLTSGDGSRLYWASAGRIFRSGYDGFGVEEFMGPRYRAASVAVEPTARIGTTRYKRCSKRATSAYRKRLRSANRRRGASRRKARRRASSLRSRAERRCRVRYL